MPNKPSISYKLLTSQHFDQVISLANKVHGDGYLCPESMAAWAVRGIKDNINSSYIALDGEQVVGFRITFSTGQWNIDKWSTPELWQIPSDLCCYFKCNTIDSAYRGQGVGKHLLNLSIDAVKKQGAVAGVAHLWQQSPNNSAVAYFSRCGGQLVKLHPGKWHEDSKQGYDCVLCGNDCHCEAAEMIIHFT
jgi:GNAT superfamily N-acetyltransferase